jgi:hypothetical protein
MKSTIVLGKPNQQLPIKDKGKQEQLLHLAYVKEQIEVKSPKETES